MTLVQLRHLLSLAETGSFSRSAEALFITQPALSRSIRGLEAELGQPLLDCIGWRSELTAFGREMLLRASASWPRPMNCAPWPSACARAPRAT